MNNLDLTYAPNVATALLLIITAVVIVWAIIAIWNIQD